MKENREVVKLIKNAQDDKALSLLYKSVLPKVKNYVKRNNGTEEEAKDIFQDAVIIFYKHVKLNKFDEERSDPAGFIFTVARNLYITLAKRKSRMISTETSDILLDAKVPDHTVIMITRERENMISELLGKAGERCREILFQTIFHKLSMKEVCEKFGFSNENAAKTANYKCKQKLFEFLDNNPSYIRILKDAGEF